MPVAVVACRAQIGLQAPLVRVEVSLDCGLPTFNIVGLPATVVKESRDRVRAALVNAHFEFPAGRITVNLSPADIPKRGGRFDLPIALGILLASGEVKMPCVRTRRGASEADQPFRRAIAVPGEFYGELGLSGALKPVPGILLAAASAAREGHEIVIPYDNAEEVRVLLQETVTRKLVVRAATHLLDVCSHLSGQVPLKPLSSEPGRLARPAPEGLPDMGDVKGQLAAKRALAVAAAGGHSLLMIGPPGAGKSMLAMRLPGLLPPLSDTESLEVAAIASASGTGFRPETFGQRPVRTPHHTASAVSLIGGGARARPGEISLAHHGVLFLDELLEFDRRALEALREPLESGVVSIARASLQACYPAQFQLVAAMNPCPCGRYGDPAGACSCTPAIVAQYRARVSAPLLDRLDIHLEVPRVDTSDFEAGTVATETTAVIAEGVRRARRIQLLRQERCNARLPDSLVYRYCAPDRPARRILEQAMRVLQLSARARQRILRLARTIADLDGVDVIGTLQVTEAITYRSLDRRASAASGDAPAPASAESIRARGC